MRHRVHGRHLGRETSHRLSLYRTLVTDLLRYERITTTEAKAKEIRPMAERIITLGRRGDLHARRQASRRFGVCLSALTSAPMLNPIETQSDNEPIKTHRRAAFIAAKSKLNIMRAAPGRCRAFPDCTAWQSR